MKENFPATFPREIMPVGPPTFSDCLAVDAAVIEHRDGVFESGRPRNSIEICKRPLGLVASGARFSWPLCAAFPLHLRRYPWIASRGERVRARAL
jgi:hypothetical protein